MNNTDHNDGGASTPYLEGVLKEPSGFRQNGFLLSRQLSSPFLDEELFFESEFEEELEELLPNDEFLEADVIENTSAPEAELFESHIAWDELEDKAQPPEEHEFSKYDHDYETDVYDPEEELLEEFEDEPYDEGSMTLPHTDTEQVRTKTWEEEMDPEYEFEEEGISDAVDSYAAGINQEISGSSQEDLELLDEQFLDFGDLYAKGRFKIWFGIQTLRKNYLKNEPHHNIDQFPIPGWIKPADFYKEFMAKHGDAATVIIGDTSKRVSAQYFVIHDTATAAEFTYKRIKRKKNGIHLWINANINPVRDKDLSDKGLGVKLERRRNNCFLHIEVTRSKSLYNTTKNKLVDLGLAKIRKDRLRITEKKKVAQLIEAAGGVRNFGTFYNDRQYELLAYAYLVASIRKGKLLTVTIHREVDRSVVRRHSKGYGYGHNDPQFFDMTYFYGLVSKLLKIDSNVTYGIQPSRVMALGQSNRANYINVFFPYVLGKAKAAEQYGPLKRVGSDSPYSIRKYLVKLKYGYYFNASKIPRTHPKDCPINAIDHIVTAKEHSNLGSSTERNEPFLYMDTSSPQSLAEVVQDGESFHESMDFQNDGEAYQVEDFEANEYEYEAEDEEFVNHQFMERPPISATDDLSEIREVEHSGINVATPQSRYNHSLRYALSKLTPSAEVVASDGTRSRGFGAPWGTGKFNKNFWVIKKDPAKRRNRAGKIVTPWHLLELKPGKSPYDALIDLMKDSHKWTYECASYIQAVHLFALAQSRGRKRVEQWFRTRKTWLRYFWSPGIKSRFYFRKKTKRGSWRRYLGKGRWKHSKLDDATLLSRTAVGSRVMWHNIRGKGAWKNENTVKVGNDQYRAFPLFSYRPVSGEQVALGLASYGYKNSHPNIDRDVLEERIYSDPTHSSLNGLRAYTKRYIFLREVSILRPAF